MSPPDSGIDRSGQGVGAAGSRSASNSAIDELTNRLRSSAGSAAPAAHQRTLAAAGARRYAVPALVTVCILGAAVFLGTRMWPTSGEAARALASRLASTVPILRSLMAPEPAPAEEPPQPPSAPAGPRRSRVRPQPPLVSRAPGAPAFDAPPVLIERPPLPSVAAIEEPDDPTVYSSADREVAPPKARLTDMAGAALGSRRPSGDMLELLVSDNGTVEHAELHTREPQMLDSMLLSRVKTWHFDPARRQGHPVAYHLWLVWDGSQFTPAAGHERLLPVVRSASR